MFIVCPSCSGPYRIPADQIAPLVQTACPHCEYRIILDFEAANEPALREAGQQFAQGFESIEAYASVYEHVTSKPDVQPRLGVTSVTVQSTGTAQVAQAAGAAQAARPLQRPAPEPTPVPTPVAAVAAPVSTPETSQPAAGSAGNRHKTVLQVPSKKPVSMEPKVETPAPSLTTSGTSTMRAGKGVDVVDEPRADEPKVEARTQPASEPSDRKPPHTPPTTGVVSSGPPASETPTPVPDDIAAQSGKHKVETKPAETKPAEAAPVVKAPEPGSNALIYIVILVVIGGVVALVLMNR